MIKTNALSRLSGMKDFRKSYKCMIKSLVFGSLEITGRSRFTRNDIKPELEKLHIDYCIPLTLFLEGHKYQGIADYLAVSVEVIKTRVNTARKELQKSLEAL